ncbi:MAG: ornithine cyclodeaminase family protein [Clostridia bacterium]|nr:ornithine cyclodeaminase family protein [Clostridia bacterium]
MANFEERALLISNADVQKYVTVEDVIEIVEKTWTWFGNDQIIMPPKITTDMSSAGVDGWFNSMPNYIKPLDIAGIKVVGGYNGNKKKGMPYIKANVLLTDPHSGMLKALVAGDWISDMRTGAQPAIMCKRLAYKTDTVTIIGAGLQGYTSLLCMTKLLDIKKVYVCDLSEQARLNFIAKFDGTGIEFVSCIDNQSACEDSDIIITVTTADADLVKASWVKEGALVITMGSFKEVEFDVVRQADVIAVDHVAQALHRGNLKPLAELGEIDEHSFDIEIGLLLAGKQTYTPDPKKRVYAQIVGMGCPDVAVAETARLRAEKAKDNVKVFDVQG